VSFGLVIGELNSFTTGWVTYFRYAKAKSILADMDSWIRRRLRCVRLKQRKRAASIATFLQQAGVPKHQSGRPPPAGRAGGEWPRRLRRPTPWSSQWFQNCGLVNLLERYLQLPH
jgi:RNA-directed DNA polymerase